MNEISITYRWFIIQRILDSPVLSDFTSYVIILKPRCGIFSFNVVHFQDMNCTLKGLLFHNLHGVFAGIINVKNPYQRPPGHAKRKRCFLTTHNLLQLPLQGVVLN